MLTELAIVVYIITFTITESKLFEKFREKSWEMFSCYFCCSFWISLGIVAFFSYVRLDSGNYYLNIPFNVFIVMFTANVVYWLFEVLKRSAKYLETADYEKYQKIENGKDSP